MKALDRKLLRDTWHLWAQLLAVSLVVASGVAMWLTLKSAHASLVLSVDSYYSAYRFADVFAHMRRAPRSVAARASNIPGVVAVQQRIVRYVTLDVPRLDEPATGRVISIPEVWRPMLNDLVIREGRWIAPNRPDEVIISDSFAAKNDLHPGDRIGAILNGRWRSLVVAGTASSPEFIYDIPAGGLLPDQRRSGILWMSQEALEAAFDMEGGFNSLALTVSHGTNIRDVIAQLDNITAEWGSTGAFGRDEQVSHRFISDEIRSLEITSAFIPAIFLAVAAFLIHLVLSRLVQLQRDQIAILKAFGYDSITVGFHFLEMALLVVGIGALLGIAGGLYLGRGMMGIYQEFYNLPLLRYVAPPSVFATSIAISALAAGAGALSAVARAVKLPPAEAMRPESPPSFHAGPLERLGLRKFFHPATRIIIRNLARRKMKSFLTVLGIAMAAAILVVGRFNTDGINHLMEVQFGVVQREDVTVTFVQTRPVDAAWELANLPGVMRVEPFRSVPVRLSNGHRFKRTILFGMRPDASLRRLVDAEHRAAPVPPEGIVITSYLAEMLGVKAGDLLTVEVTDESRPTRRIPISATVNEQLGVMAYMDLGALNRLMEEGHTTSGAWLLVEDGSEARLYQELKQIPAVAGVTSRSSMLQSFLDTIAEMMGVVNSFVIFFACVIAIGVVYNGARIALSERGRELASLRVLGFTRAEVSAMLLGEQALLTLMAVPLGFLIGYLISAWLATMFQTDLYRFPLVISSETWAFAFIVIAAASVISALLVRRRIDKLDLVEVLKTRE